MMANISVLRKSTEEENNELKKTSASKLLVTDNDDASDFHTQVMQYEKDKLVPYKLEIVWRNVFVMTVLHLAALVGFYNILFNSKAQTGFWYLALGSLSGFGILVGAHRLWTHRSFKAHWSVRTVLMILQTMALQVNYLLLFWLLSLRLIWIYPVFRMTYLSGLVIIVCTTNSRKRMPIRITQNGDSSLPMLVGCCVANIQM